MENSVNGEDIKLVIHEEKFDSRPNFKICTKFSKNFLAIYMGKLKVHYKKPLYPRFSILKLCKIVFYIFFMNTIKINFGHKVSLMHTNINSLIIKIYTDNFTPITFIILLNRI